MQSSTRLITLTPEQVQGLIEGRPITFSNQNQVYPSYQSNIQPQQQQQVFQLDKQNPIPKPIFEQNFNQNLGIQIQQNPIQNHGIKQNFNQNQGNQSNLIRQSQQIINNMEGLKTMYFENLICLWVTYEILLLICLILQFLGCQSISAGNLWISIEVFLVIIGLANYGFWEFLQQQLYKYIAFSVQLFFFFLITILEIPAFALAVKYPTLIQYLGEAGLIGDCVIYSEMYSTDYGGEIKYEQPAQYVLLILFLIQFFYSAYFTFMIARKNWRVFLYLRNLPPQDVQQIQQIQNQVIIQQNAQI